MPVMRGRDAEGPFYRWGVEGKKYHYKSGNLRSRIIAKRRAAEQGRAIRSQGYKG